MGDQSSHMSFQFQPGRSWNEDSSLTYFVPRATDFAPDQVFKDDSLPFEKLLESVEKRESLFFDESVDVILVLKIPHTDDSVMGTAIRSIVITLDVQIVNGSVPERDGSPASEAIFSDTIEGSHDDVVVLRKSTSRDETGGSEPEGYIYAVWRRSVFLHRPRMRLHGPSVIFVATPGARYAGPSSDRVRTSYMPSGVASSLNLLESFGSDPALKGVKPRLSAVRVSRVAPVTQQANELIRPIKALSRLSFRIYPAAHSRIRFTHPNTVPPSPAVVAMLEIDFTPFFDCEIILQNISLTTEGATVEDLTERAGLSLPLSCVAHDHITFLYRLVPTDTEVRSQNVMRNLDIAISATALMDDHVKPLLKMAWTAAVDFTVPVNPGYGSAMQPIQRAHRPSQLSIGGESTTSLTAPSVARPDALPSLEASTTGTETPVQELGITVTFTAPSNKIFVGDIFSWAVLVANRSPHPSAAARKLAMVIIPKRRRNESRVNRPPSTLRLPDSLHTSSPDESMDIAEATLDDNVIHAMQSGSIVGHAELVCLSAEVRIGPLAPGTCHETELRFLALKAGLVGVDAVRIIDLSNNEHVDIRHLPSVTVEKKAAGDAVSS
ncbi:TRAPP trafficking subunit Trs65-domain-containing protein [Xylariaceae sp. FL0594]|nr:TRAPP trafficking subunit Trs65-domain-containing protein [Xylariaceae sp. FL0594]